jgi:6-phosphofructokinase 2
MAEIVTLTMNPAIDVSTAVDHVVSDRKLRCGAARYEPGGGGINVSRTIRRLSGDSLAVYPAGGPAGALLYALLEKEGVGQRPLPIETWTRENLNVREEATGRQFRFVFPGPKLSSQDWGRCLAEIESLSPVPRFLVASGSLPPGVPEDFYARAARVARQAGSRFLLDTAGVALTQALDEGVFLIKPSLGEFQALTGLADAEEAHLRDEAERLIARGRCEVVVLSLGSAGILLVTHEDAVRIFPPTVPAQSVVGAGDTLLAGIVLYLARGRPMGEAARFGVAAAAATCMRPGTELCRREDAERLFGQMLPVAV